MGLTTTDSVAGTSNDQTIIVDGVSRPPPNGFDAFFSCSPAVDKNFRITGITFKGVSPQTVISKSTVAFLGLCPNVRLDHCHFTHLNLGSLVALYAAVFGVADHNVFDDLQGQYFSYSVTMPNYGGGANDYGDGAFAESAGFGGSKFWFVEDNYINFPTFSGSGGGGVDMFYGGRLVWRHNKCFNIALYSHSTGKSAPRGRGGRAMEVYNNQFSYDTVITIPGISNGSVLVHDNDYYGSVPNGIALAVLRAFYNNGSPFYGANGANAWDLNDVTDHTGNGFGGGSGGLYASGTVSGVTSFTMTSTGAGWTTNQWTGYTVRDIDLGSTVQNSCFPIVSNTADTLTLYGGGFTMDWPTNDHYEIRKVIHFLDDIGRGWGDLISGVTPTPAWPNQTHLEPCYSWNNIYHPSNTLINFNPSVNGGTPNLTEGVDYYNDTTMPGYTPYTYPHPLVTAGQPMGGGWLPFM